MELKHHVRVYLVVQLILLIVPYGIETMSNFLNKETLQILLIVPYGIETL